jgi:LysR family hydrogen peroxide-inducible transcriptional activator
LTEAGRALLPEAVAILRQVTGARTKVESLQQGVAGRLVVGCIPTVTPYFLAPNLQDFAESYPEVELRLLEETTPVLVEMLQGGDIDLAVISPPVTNPDVVCSDLFREPILVAISPDHPIAQERTISLSRLKNERLLLLKEGHCFRDNALTLCSRSRTTFGTTFETNQFASILALVAAGFGVSLVPQMASKTDSRCVFVPLDREAHRRIGYMRVRQHALGTAQKAFIRWLRELASRN